MERIFPTFCHVGDYDDIGFSLIPQMIESSYPLILWAPPGARINDYYNREICPISPEQLIHYVEQGFVQIMGRENWLLDKQHRQKYAQEKPFAKWCDNFDGALKSIWRDQQSMPEHERSVRIAPEEEGWEWAKDQLKAEPELIDPIWERIKKKRIPPVSLRRIREKGYGEENKFQAVLQVLRDARDHTKAIQDADVKLPFLLKEDDGKFFRYLERIAVPKLSHQSKAPPGGVIVQFSQEVHRLLERLKYPEKVPSLDEFIGSETHKDLAKWLYSVSDLAQLDWSRKNLRKFLMGQLKRDIETALPSSELWNVLGTGRVLRGATVAGLLSGIASLFFPCFTFAPGTPLTLTGILASLVPIGNGISRRLGIIKPDYPGPQWPYFLKFGKNPRKWDLEAVPRILGLLIEELNEY